MSFDTPIVETATKTADLVEVASQPLSTEEKLTPEQQMAGTIKILKMQQKALNDLVVLDLRNLLNMLTAPNMKESVRKQIRETIERAIVMGFDYGVDVIKPTMKEHGTLGKLECSFAAHMARLKENGMILIADAMDKSEKEKLNQSMKGENQSEENHETQGNENSDANPQNGETHSEANNQSQSENHEAHSS